MKKILILIVLFFYFWYFLGQTVQIPVHPSKVVITKLKMDKDRQAILDRRNRTKKFSTKKVTEKQASGASPMAIVD